MAASYDEVREALHDAVKTMAQKAAAAGSPTPANGWAEAAKNLAEANAWLTSAGQPH